MPVAFLSEDYLHTYGRFTGEPSPAQLDRYFHLDDADQALTATHHGSHHRLGFALQLCTVRFLGTFLINPLDVPPGAVAHVARQLRIVDASCLARYLERPTTHWEHAMEIRRRYGYRDFTDQPAHFRLVRWLYTRTWLSIERPSVLFEYAIAWLIQHKVLLPGMTVLERLIASVHERVTARLWRLLAAVPTAEQRAGLEVLLEVPEGARATLLDRLRRAPTRVSAPGLVGALQRVGEVRKLGLGGLHLPQVPSGRLKALARYAAAARAQTIARMPPTRRIATLLAFAHQLEPAAQDDALDILDQLITALFARVDRQGQQERLRTLKDLDAAALQLQEACAVILDPACADADVRATIFGRLSRAQLTTAVDRVRALARPPDDTYHDKLVERYGHVRRFLPPLLRTITFAGTPAGQPVVEVPLGRADVRYTAPYYFGERDQDAVRSVWE